MSAEALLSFFLLHFFIGAVLPPPKDARPVLFRMIEALGLELNRRLNREHRKKAELFARGFLVVFVLFFAALGLGFLAAHAGQGKFSWGWQALLLLLSASAMRPVKALQEAARALQKGGKASAEKTALVFERRAGDVEKHPDPFRIGRSAVAWSAESLDAHFTGPLVWYGLGGAPGVAVYVTVSALRRAFFLRRGTPPAFSVTAGLLDECLNVLPAFLTVLLISFSALFVSGAHPAEALLCFVKQKKNYKNGVAGWPVAALAGALHVTLGGPGEWMGPEGSSARVSIEDMKRCTMIHFVFFLCVMVLVACGILVFQFFT